MASVFCGADCGVFDGVLSILSGRGGSKMCGGTFMVCRAIIVAEGGVFSPRIGRADGRNEGVSLKVSRLDGVGVPRREGLRSPPK